MQKDTKQRESLGTTIEAVRKLAIAKQGLDRHPKVINQKTLQKTIERIGIVQLDSINVVERSHYLVMFSRLGNYRKEYLDSLLFPRREVFEQWAHAQCIIPISDYRYFAPIIRARRDMVKSGSRHYSHIEEDEKDQILEEMMERFRREGPLMSKHFNSKTKLKKEQDDWWNWKSHKHAIQVLFDDGYIMVHKRVGFQRYYDITERILPKGSNPMMGDLEDSKLWFAERALSCLGIGTVKHISDYYRRRTSETLDAIHTMLKDDRVVEVHVDGWKNRAYMLKEDVPELKKHERNSTKHGITTLLSPFDNLIWERTRTLSLFDFKYRLAVYDSTKEGAKKREGYYVMPILHNNMLIGRMDPKVFREKGILVLHSIKLEEGVKPDDEIIDGIYTALKEFMNFNNCKEIRIEVSEPRAMKQLLMTKLMG